MPFFFSYGVFYFKTAEYTCFIVYSRIRIYTHNPICIHCGTQFFPQQKKNISFIFFINVLKLIINRIKCIFCMKIYIIIQFNKKDMDAPYSCYQIKLFCIGGRKSDSCSQRLSSDFKP